MSTPSSRAALRVLESVFGHATPLPVPVMPIARFLKWRVSERPIADAAGVAATVGSQRQMLINSAMTTPQKRGTIAHEIGHDLVGDPDQQLHIMGEGMVETFDEWVLSQSERGAWLFAAHLLIPWWAFDDSLWDPSNPDALHTLCEVTPSLVTVRMGI